MTLKLIFTTTKHIWGMYWRNLQTRRQRMKNKLIILTCLLPMLAANAQSSLLRSLQDNILQAQAIERQERQRYENAKAAYNASKSKVRSAKSRYKKARVDELKEDRQMRAIAKANAEYYDIPNYHYSANNTDLTWRTK
jgi:hypothetical protein